MEESLMFLLVKVPLPLLLILFLLISPLLFISPSPYNNPDFSTFLGQFLLSINSLFDKFTPFISALGVQEHTLSLLKSLIHSLCSSFSSPIILDPQS